MRRLKTYSASSGHVYQYYYEGSRDGRGCREHVFAVTSDRKAIARVSVLVCDSAVSVWESRHERQLSANERYAVAKMSLFAAFDEKTPQALREPIIVDEAAVEEILAMLGRD